MIHSFIPVLMQLFPICRSHGKSKQLRDQRRIAAWVLERESKSMEAEQHRLSDQVGQMQSKLDRAALHRDLIVGMELQKKDPRVSGYQNGKVLYKQPDETPDERRFRIFGTHEFIGSGPYGDGSWIQWGKPFKAPTHAEVQAFLKARDRRIAASKASKNRQ